MTIYNPGAAPKQAALLTYQDLADWLNDSVRHLRRLVDERRIPYIKVGHYVRFDEREIQAWLEANRRAGISQRGRPPEVETPARRRKRRFAREPGRTVDP